MSESPRPVVAEPIHLQSLDDAIGEAISAWFASHYPTEGSAPPHAIRTLTESVLATLVKIVVTTAIAGRQLGIEVSEAEVIERVRNDFRAARAASGEPGAARGGLAS